MVPNVAAILQRFTTKWTALMQADAILAACREIRYTAWRDRLFVPVRPAAPFHRSCPYLAGPSYCDSPNHCLNVAHA
jgi:hypothetical protein